MPRMTHPLKLNKPKVKIAEYNSNGETIYFNIPKGECFFIDIRDKEDREKFAYDIANTELCGLASEGKRNTWEEAFRWVVDSDLPLIVYKDKCMLSRVQKRLIVDNTEVVEVKYSSQNEVKYFAQKYSKTHNEELKRFRIDLSANGMIFNDEEYKEIEEIFSEEIYYAYLDNHFKYIPPLIETVRKYFYTEDIIFECFMEDKVSPQMVVYQVHDREVDNFVVSQSNGRNFSEEYYTLSDKAITSIKKMVNSGFIKKINQGSVIEAFENAKKGESNINYVYIFKYFEPAQQEFQKSEKEIVLPSAHWPHRKKVFAQELGYIKDKVNNLSISMLVFVHDSICETMYHETGVKMPLK